MLYAETKRFRDHYQRDIQKFIEHGGTVDLKAFFGKLASEVVRKKFERMNEDLSKPTLG